MKTLLYLTSLILGIFIYTGCSEKDTPDTGEPIRYNIYFEILKRDSTSFDEGEVELSEPLEVIDGEFAFPGEEIRWHKLKIDTQVSNALEKTIFEPVVFSGWSSEWNYSGTPEWEQNTYYLFKFPEGDIDTLRINDNTVVKPRRQDFMFFLNDEPKKEIIITDEGQSGDEPWILLIQK